MTTPPRPESFPQIVDFQTANTRLEFQGGIPSCTAFGMTSALEAMADRAGAPVQLSPRYLWFYCDKTHLSVESTYPYAVQNADEMPSLPALLDAQHTAIQVSTQRIAGKVEAMRALATGHSLITIRLVNGSAEHCEAAIGYDADKGLKIIGSGLNIYFEPWDQLNSEFTQLWALTGPYPLVPHPDYYEGDLPVFDGDRTLTMPFVDVVIPWPQPWARAADVKVYFDSFGTVTLSDPNVLGHIPRWANYRSVLTIPVLLCNGVRYTNVTLFKPSFQLLHYDDITPAQQQA
jgi:hypothetical protein